MCLGMNKKSTSSTWIVRGFGVECLYELTTSSYLYTVCMSCRNELHFKTSMWCWTRPINIRHDSNHDLTFSTFFILSSNSEFFLILSTLNFPKSQFLFSRGGSKKTTIPLYQKQQNTFAFFVSFNTRNWWRRELITFTSIIKTSSRR